MTTELNANDPRDPIEQIAVDFGADAAPLAVTGVPDFEAFCAVADDLSDDIEHAIRAEVDA